MYGERFNVLCSSSQKRKHAFQQGIEIFLNCSSSRFVLALFLSWNFSWRCSCCQSVRGARTTDSCRRIPRIPSPPPPSASSDTTMLSLCAPSRNRFNLLSFKHKCRGISDRRSDYSWCRRKPLDDAVPISDAATADDNPSRSLCCPLKSCQALGFFHLLLLLLLPLLRLLLLEGGPGAGSGNLRGGRRLRSVRAEDRGGEAREGPRRKARKKQRNRVCILRWEEAIAKPSRGSSTHLCLLRCSSLSPTGLRDAALFLSTTAAVRAGAITVVESCPWRPWS